MIKKALFWIAISVTIVKCSFLGGAHQWLDVVGWAIVGSWFIAIGYAYQKNRDLPMVGPFNYKEGANQLGRTIAAVVMTSIFFIAAAFG